MVAVGVLHLAPAVPGVRSRRLASQGYDTVSSARFPFVAVGKRWLRVLLVNGSLLAGGCVLAAGLGEMHTAERLARIASAIINRFSIIELTACLREHDYDPG